MDQWFARERSCSDGRQCFACDLPAGGWDDFDLEEVLWVSDKDVRAEEDVPLVVGSIPRPFRVFHSCRQRSRKERALADIRISAG